MADRLSMRLQTARLPGLDEWSPDASLAMMDEAGIEGGARQAELFSRHGTKLYLDQVLAKKQLLRA